MKAVIIARGRGVILLESSGLKTKAVVPLNKTPLLFFVLRHFYFYQVHEIIICVDSTSDKDINHLITKYKKIPRFNYFLKKINLKIINAGKNNKTGSMLFDIKDMFVNGDFIVTSHDVITDVNLSQLIQYHKSKGKILTVLGVHPTVRQGVIKHEDGLITSYDLEKPVDTIIKGGYFVMKPSFFEYLTDDCFFEREPFQKLISNKQAVVYNHTGFWKHVDSWRELEELEKLYKKDDVSSWIIK